MQTPTEPLQTPPEHRESRFRAGFTLIELMVVIMIIGIISGVVLTAMGTGNNSRNVDAGITRLDSLFSLARSAAITRQQTTRVLIHFDPTDEDKFLRYATIVYLDVEENGDEVWKLYSEGIFLPGGVYVSPSLSSTSDNHLFAWGLQMDPTDLTITQPSDNELKDAGSDTLSGNKDLLNLTNAPGQSVWLAYEFLPNGTFSKPLSRVVLVGAILLGLPGNAELLITTEGDDNSKEVIAETAKGFVIFRSGKVLHFQSGEQILEGNEGN